METYALLDDGTIDTVIEVTCNICGNQWEERFSDTSEYREDDGYLSDEKIKELMEDFDVYCESCPEILGRPSP